MNTEQELNLAADMIKRDAPSQGIDFEDPANAYTVWTPFPNRMQFCGNRRTLDEAYSLAGDHIRLKNLYVVKGPLSRPCPEIKDVISAGHHWCGCEHGTMNGNAAQSLQ